MNADDLDRFETLESLAQMFALVQAMAHRLANETHGPAYDAVWELNEILHMGRVKVESIRAESGDLSRVLVERRTAVRSGYEIPVL